MFISEFENKEGRCNVMPASFKRLPELSEISGN